MISIITATHNQLGVNKLYIETLKKYCSLPYELIVIDNNSNDGSAKFLKDNADVFIQNDGNYSYPYCQNQGIKNAKYEYLAFLNNDIIVSPDWDKKAIETMERNQLDVLSFATLDHLESVKSTVRAQKKWRFVKYPLLKTLGNGYHSLKLMWRIYYGNWIRFNEKWSEKYKGQLVSGISGSCIIIKRSAIEKIGKWDERLQSADWDLMFRTIQRFNAHGDVQPIKIAMDIYLHHYQKLTAKFAPHPPFRDQDNLIDLSEKWGSDIVKQYSKYNTSNS